MTIHVYNTLTRRLEPLVPIEPGHVRMYVCGMTTYDYCHLGHGRTFAAFDVVVRWLRARGLRVTYVRNITDVDDKIIRRAAENGETTTALTERFIRAMHEDFAALGLLPPDLEPRATQYVPQMLGLIELLEKNGLAYAAEDGDVNFAVRRFRGYGKLSGKSLDELRAGERVAVDQAKRDPLDGRSRTALALTQMARGSGEQGLEDLRAISASDTGVSADLALISNYLKVKDYMLTLSDSELDSIAEAFQDVEFEKVSTTELVKKLIKVSPKALIKLGKLF